MRADGLMGRLPRAQRGGWAERRTGTVIAPGANAEGAEQQLELLARHLPIRPSAHLPILDQRARGTTFIALPVRSVLNSPAATHMGFWSINPYIGCEFGCTYCYARDTHRYAVERAVRRHGGGMAVSSEASTPGDAAQEGQVDINSLPPYRPTALPPWLAFERHILVKTEVAEVLGRTLDPSKLGDHSLVIGTATDPYQPAERRFRLTRKILERLLDYRALSISIITKSPLVVRDLDLLQQLSARNDVSVNISLATLDSRLARRLELRSPVPRVRLRALERLTTAGIKAGLLMAPILPGITDDWAGLAALMQAGKEAGAHFADGAALRLGPAARHRFLPVLAQEFPDLAERYRRHFDGRDNTTREYTDALERRIRSLQRAYGFPVHEETRRQRIEDRKQRGRDAEVQDAEQQTVLL